MKAESFKVKVLVPWFPGKGKGSKVRRTRWLTRWSGDDEAAGRREFARWKEQGATVRLVGKVELDRHDGHVKELRGSLVDWPTACHQFADLVTDMLCHFDDVPADMHERARQLIETAQNGIDLRPVREFSS